MFAAERGPPQFEAAFEQRGRAVVDAEAAVDRADRTEQLRLDDRRTGQLGVDPIGAAVEQLARGDWAAHARIGIRDLEELRQEGEHLLSGVALARGAVALFGQARRLHREGHGGGADEQHQQGCRAHAPPVPGHETRGDVRPTGRPRFHWPAIEMPPQVAGEGFDRHVALGLLLVQRLADDRVEVTREAGAQAGRCGAPRPRAFLGRGDAIRPFPRGHTRLMRGDVTHDALDLGAGHGGKAQRPRAGHELVEQHAERVDVGGRRHLFAAHHFWTGVLGREHPPGRLRRGRVGRALEREPRDPEVEQFRHALFGDHDVARLDVAVHDQAAVRVTHCVAHLEEELQPGVHREAPRVAVLVDRHALDVLHHQIGQALGGGAAVEQAGDVRVLEPRQDLALRAELPHALGIEPAAHHFDGDLLQELVVVALGEIHRAHAALAEHLHELVGAQTLERRARTGGGLGHGVTHDRHERPTGVLFAIGGEQTVYELGEIAVGRFAIDERRARVAGARERRFEELLRRRPAFGGHSHASWPRDDAVATPRRRCRGR